MKQFVLIAIAMIALVGFTSAQTRNGLVLTDTQAAIDYMYANGLTKFNTTATFMANQSLRRDEAAAFFARFARDVLDMVPDTSKAECNTFTDLSLAHNDLKSEIIASCQLGLFKGSNGKFMPTASFSNAHAVTVIVRLLDDDQPEGSSHWAWNYLMRAKTLGLINGLSADNNENLDRDISRGDVARLIEAGSAQREKSKGIDDSIATIKGTLSYPSEGIPDMKICAVNTSTEQETCVDNNGDAYDIIVEAGTYIVYAETNNHGNTTSELKAYYTQCDTYEHSGSYMPECNPNFGTPPTNRNHINFICYNDPVCRSSFTPLMITIEAGETKIVERIGHGWYIPCSHDIETCNNPLFDVREDYL